MKITKKENTCQKQAKYVPKETLENKICCVNWTPLDFLEKDGVIPTKNVKEKMQNLKRRLEKFKSWNGVKGRFDYLVIPIKAFKKIFNEEIGEVLLK